MNEWLKGLLLAILIIVSLKVFVRGTRQIKWCVVYHFVSGNRYTISKMTQEKAMEQRERWEDILKGNPFKDSRSIVITGGSFDGGPDLDDNLCVINPRTVTHIEIKAYYE